VVNLGPEAITVNNKRASVVALVLTVLLFGTLSALSVVGALTRWTTVSQPVRPWVSASPCSSHCPYSASC
jgi:hypothetical protein